MGKKGDHTGLPVVGCSIAGVAGRALFIVMMNLEQFRALLGDVALGRSDAEIERIREIHYGLADAIFESWLSERAAQPEEYGMIPDINHLHHDQQPPKSNSSSPC